MSGIMNKIHPGHQNVSSSSSYNGIEGPIQSERTIIDAPIIQETIRNDRIIEVQPVLHREVDQNVVHHIEKHIQEAAAPNMGGIVEMAPLYQQQVHTSVVNEIQPIIHRERVVTVAERVEEHHMERIVEPTVHTHEVIYENAPVSSLSSFSTVPSATTSTKHGLFHRH